MRARRSEGARRERKEEEEEEEEERHLCRTTVRRAIIRDFDRVFRLATSLPCIASISQ